MSAQTQVIPAGETAPPIPLETLPNELPAAPAPASPLDLPAEVFRSGLDRRRENRAALMEWVREALVEGVDFGRIHVESKNKCAHGKHCKNPAHFSKPSLFKPGAEKICGMLGVSVHFPTLHDYEQAALHGINLVHIIIRCEIHDAASRVVADGVGARSLKQDYGDINKALKMAEKSAHIDATLRMAGLSEIFTQDMEDMNHGKELEKESQNPGAHPPQTETPTTITPAQHKRLEARIKELGLDRQRIKDWIERASKGTVKHFPDLNPSMYKTLDAKLEQWAEREATPSEAAQ